MTEHAQQILHFAAQHSIAYTIRGNEEYVVLVVRDKTREPGYVDLLVAMGSFGCNAVNATTSYLRLESCNFGKKVDKLRPERKKGQLAADRISLPRDVQPCRCHSVYSKRGHSCGQLLATPPSSLAATLSRRVTEGLCELKGGTSTYHRPVRSNKGTRHQGHDDRAVWVRVDLEKRQSLGTRPGDCTPPTSH